jgi:hypothetical protein
MQISEQKEARVAQWRDFVTERLGREPRGFCDVSAFNAQGKPAVIRVSSVVDGKPFPTLFWLIDANISLKIDRLEAAGWIARLQRDVDISATLQEQMALAHEAHKRVRETFLSEAERTLLTDRGMMSALADRGIGGIKEPNRIRCLHTWYAAHMVEANCIGSAIDQLMASAENFEWRLG